MSLGKLPFEFELVSQASAAWGDLGAGMAASRFEFDKKKYHTVRDVSAGGKYDESLSGLTVVIWSFYFKEL
jgi:hypothetical protein